MKMKKLILFFKLIATYFILIGCEDVIEVNLEETKPKLVIEATILWHKGTNGNIQKIKLSTTTGYYNTSIPYVSNAIVSIADESNTIFQFDEIPETGEYICTNFIPQLNINYTLTIIHEGETYTSTEKLIPVPSIDNVEQRNDAGFTGEDIEVKFYYQDNGLENNFYLTQFNTNSANFPEYEVDDDQYFQGNQMFGLYSNEDLKSNDYVIFTLQGISERTYNYLNVLLGIAGGNGGSPFSTPPATVRGNIINQTNEVNYPLGYFRLSEIDSRYYTVQ